MPLLLSRKDLSKVQRQVLVLEALPQDLWEARLSPARAALVAALLDRAVFEKPEKNDSRVHCGALVAESTGRMFAASSRR